MWRAQEIDDALAFPVAGGSAGLYLIETDAFGERSFQYWRKDSAARHWLARLVENGESLLHGADLVYFSGITLAILNPDERAAAIELLRRARTHVGRIAFDPNVRLRLWQSPQAAAQTIRAAMSACDIALPSAEDLAWLLGIDEPMRQLDQLVEMGVPEVALTLGAAGCAITDGAARKLLPGLSVEQVIDTSGAGDAFNGAYLANRLQGRSPDEAAQAAIRVASRVVTHAGAIVPVSVSHPAMS
jgi:2-dehydro-3-deoxygluconokinase